MKKKLFEYNAIKLTYHNGKEKWHPKARPCMKNNDDLEILCQYNGRYEAFTTIIHWRITVILLILFIISWNTVCTKPMLANINHQSQGSSKIQ